MSNPPSTPVALLSFDQVFADLKDRGYQQVFWRELNCLYCKELYLWLTPDLFSVDESYHFEEISIPDGDRTLFAITANNGTKGILVDTYGAYADNLSPEMIQKLFIAK